MVGRNEVRLDVVTHFHALDSESTQEGVQYIDIDGIGMKILSAMGVHQTFIGTPIKQFDRLYQFTIKYEKTDITSNLTDSALLKEQDIEGFLDVCKKTNMAVGIISGIMPSRAVVPYCKEMSVRGKLDDFINMHEVSKIVSGQPVIDTYQLLRGLQSKDPVKFKKMVDAVVATNTFSLSFRKMMRTLGSMQRALG